MKQSSKKVLVLTGAILTIIGLSKNPVYAGISSTHTHQTGEIVEETTVIEATPDIVE
jgi:hypothetical protein